MTENKKPSLTDIVVTGGVTVGLLNNAINIGKNFYRAVEANAPQLQEAFGNVGYEVLEKGAPVAIGLTCVSLAYIGGKATHQYLTERKATE